MEKNLMIIKIVLPDINKYDNLDNQYSDYGRLSILTNRSYWFGNISSSHPQNTLYGYYWALSRNKEILYLSPRGNSLDFEKYLSPELLSFLLKKLRLNIKSFKFLN